MKLLLGLKQIVVLGLFITNSAYAQNAEKSWSDAVVYVPGKPFTTTVSKAPVEKPMPAVIYLHGCAGINRANDASWAALLMEQWFIVVMSDSLARLGRIANCDPKLKGGNAFPNAFNIDSRKLDMH